MLSNEKYSIGTTKVFQANTATAGLYQMEHIPLELLTYFQSIILTAFLYQMKHITSELLTYLQSSIRVVCFYQMKYTPSELLKFLPSKITTVFVTNEIFGSKNLSPFKYNMCIFVELCKVFRGLLDPYLLLQNVFTCYSLRLVTQYPRNTDSVMTV